LSPRTIDLPAWALRLFPFLRWRAQVTREALRADLIAGLIGAVVVLPQGVAFATLAGLPPEYGLYAAMVPAAVAALWGSSWHLVSGPTNAISLVVFASLAQLAEPGSVHYVELAITLAFLVGLMQLGMGWLKLGTLVNFVSHTVVVGFTAGAAVLIIASQLRNFFGVDIPRGASFLETLRAFALGLPQAEPAVVAVGAITILTGLIVRRWLPRVPYMIVAMLAGSLAALALNEVLGGERASGIRTLGALPSALPHLSMPQIGLETLRQLLAAAAAVTVLGLTEAVSIARSIALRSGQRINGNQEFIGQGLSNLAGAFFAAYPSSGSFNRSGMNYESGARTPLASVFASILLVAVVFLVAPLAAYLPYAAMAGVLFLVAWGLIDFHHIATIVRTSGAEARVLAATFLATLLMHLEFAILVGVMLSLLLYLSRTSRPAIRSIIPDPADPARKFRERRAGEPECPQLRLLRIEGSLYFGAVSHVAEYLHEHAERRPGQKHLLLLGRSMNFVDLAGAELLAQEARRRAAAGGRLWFHGLRESAADMLAKAAWGSSFGDGAFFHTKREAISGVFERLDRRVCAHCEARVFTECASLPPPEPKPSAAASTAGSRAGPAVAPAHGPATAA
jgi:SulP family sulfate permease